MQLAFSSLHPARQAEAISLSNLFGIKQKILFGNHLNCGHNYNISKFLFKDLQKPLRSDTLTPDTPDWSSQIELR